MVQIVFGSAWYHGQGARICTGTRYTHYMYIAENSKYYYRVVVSNTQHTNPGRLQQWYVTAVSSTWYVLIRTLQQLGRSTAVYEYS